MLKAPSVLPSDVRSSIAAAGFRVRLLRRLPLLQEDTSKLLETTQGRYKRYFDKKVRVVTELRRGDRVFFDRPRRVQWTSWTIKHKKESKRF